MRNSTERADQQSLASYGRWGFDLEGRDPRPGIALAYERKGRDQTPGRPGEL